MSPDESRFLAAVCAAPDDDAPRLIYADWLEERHDPRGEFIRLQIALARLPPNDPRRPDLEHRQNLLHSQFAPSWIQPLRRLVSYAEFRRGFVEIVNVDARTFLAQADRLWLLAPIREIRFLDVGSHLERLLSHPALARLEAISIFAQHIDDRLAAALVDAAHIDRLRFLNIARNRIGDRGVERLAASPRLRRLRGLNLSDNIISDRGARALAESRYLADLEELRLRRNELSRHSLSLLLATSQLASLRVVDLAQNYIGEPASAHLPGPGRCLSRLASLDLGDCGVGNDIAPILAILQHAPHLAELNLERNEIGNLGAAQIAHWPGAANLRALKLNGNRIGDEGATALARSPYLYNLVELDLTENPIHDAGAFQFLHAAPLPRLHRLALPHLGLTPQVRRAVMQRFPG